MTFHVLENFEKNPADQVLKDKIMAVADNIKSTLNTDLYDPTLKIILKRIYLSILYFSFAALARQDQGAALARSR
jgi:hypothetical protein